MNQALEMNSLPVKDETPPSFLELGEGRRLAYHLTEGKTPGVIFLGGFKSDMTGSKARTLEAFCKVRGQRFLRFDYTGHGQSSGEFKSGTISSWKQDALDAITKLGGEQYILVGSSMGAWIALLLARELKQVRGLVCIASAPDFTEKLIWNQMTPEHKAQMEKEGLIHLSSCYGEDPYPIMRTLIEDARQHLLLDHPIPVDVPVRLIHGMKDEDVPWQHSVTLMEKLTSKDVLLTFVKDGGHRLSEPSQLALIAKTAHSLLVDLGV